MKRVIASKLHGYGNDFLVLDAGQVKPHDFVDFAKAICHPHFGIGADGCLFVSPVDASRSVFAVRIFNQDGSETGMTGNGVRCVCAYLVREGLCESTEIKIQTSSGPKVYSLIEQDEERWKFRSLMGEPLFEPRMVPFVPPEPLERVSDYPVPVDDEMVPINALFVGNPQCVVFSDPLPGDEVFHRVGKALQTHPFFPEGTNVSFVAVESADEIRIRIYERGVGPTLSSGTGSCGAAVVALTAGKVTSPVKVRTETGVQEVAWTPGSEIVLTGWADFIARVDFRWRANG